MTKKRRHDSSGSFAAIEAKLIMEGLHAYKISLASSVSRHLIGVPFAPDIFLS